MALLGACERHPVHSSRDDSPVLVRVNGRALTKTDFESFLPEDYQQVLTTDERNEYLDRWIVTELLYEDAMKSGAGLSPEVQSRLEQYKKDLIADQLIQKVISQKAVVTEAEARAYYDAHANEYLKEYRVSHILVNTLEEAEKVKSLLGQQSFTYLARRYSIDRHSGPGGDLGYLSKGNMIPEFENVVFKMHVGEVSDIVESEFGYHIIYLADIRDARVKLEFDDVKSDIANTLMMEKREAVYDSLVTAVKSRANIEIMDEDLRLTFGAGPDSIPPAEVSPEE
jgi:peptidyl-prolyl cis-trans isomerase C